jgi:hypothetical protein
MKKILKYKSLFIATMTAIFFTLPALAERVNNKQNAFPESKFVNRFSSDGLRDDSGGGIDLGDDKLPPPEDAIGPIGDAVGWLAALALVYGVYVSGKKRKNA